MIIYHKNSQSQYLLLTSNSQRDIINSRSQGRGRAKVLNNLKKALDDKGITIRAFAKGLGVDERTIQNKI